MIEFCLKDFYCSRTSIRILICVQPENPEQQWILCVMPAYLGARNSRHCIKIWFEGLNGILFLLQSWTCTWIFSVRWAPMILTASFNNISIMLLVVFVFKWHRYIWFFISKLFAVLPIPDSMEHCLLWSYTTFSGWYWKWYASLKSGIVFHISNMRLWVQNKLEWYISVGNRGVEVLL